MKNLFDLTGKVFIVTGGTGFIGLAIVKALLEMGAKVVCGSSTDEKAARIGDELGKKFSNDHFLACKLDVTCQSSITAALVACLDKFGQVTGLINCAGANLKQDFDATSVEDFQRIMDINLYGAFRVSQAVVQKMIEHGSGGVIVNICSITSFQALSGVTTYACSKAALLALTKQMAVERKLIGNGIRTVAVAPGFVPAEQNRDMLQQGTRGLRILASTPAERYCTPEEVAARVVFLCSDAASGTNGSCDIVDGGFLANGVSEANERSLLVNTKSEEEEEADGPMDAGGIGCNLVDNSSVPDRPDCQITIEEQAVAQEDECPIG